MTDQVMPEQRLDIGSIDDAISYLKQKFPSVVHDDTRAGYEGVLVDRNRLVDVALTIRDELGFD